MAGGDARRDEAGMRSYGEAEHQEDDKESQEGDGRRQELLAQKMARLLGRGGREEERKFLETLLEVRNDPSEVQRLARSRLAALGAPAPQQAESEDSDCDEPEHSEASIKVTLEGIAQGDSPVSPGLSDMSAWEARSGGFLSCCRGLATRSPSAIDNGEESFPARARALRTEGLTAFTQSDCLGTSAQVLQEGMTELSERGWPPVCAFMFDEAWAAMLSLFPVAEGLLGEGAELEPSVFAWDAGLPGNSPGASFGLPHRDYPSPEATKDGRHFALSTWVAVTEASTSSGCIHALPTSSDPLWNNPTHPHHLRPAEVEEPTGIMRLRFDLARARALPLPPGGFAMWRGDVVHWGGKPNSVSPSVMPRKSLAGTFRPENACPDFRFVVGPIDKEKCLAMGIEDRARLLCQSLLLYSQWHSIHPNSPLAVATRQ